MTELANEPSNKKREIRISSDYVFVCDNLKFETVALVLCLSPAELEQTLIHTANALSEMFTSTLEVVKDLRERINRVAFYERGRPVHKLNLARPIIKHQVLDRKPKWLVKKVIH